MPDPMNGDKDRWPEVLDRDGSPLAEGDKVIFADSNVNAQLRAGLKGWHIVGIKWTPGHGWAVGVCWGMRAVANAEHKEPWYFPKPDEKPNTYRCDNLVSLAAFPQEESPDKTPQRAEEA